MGIEILNIIHAEGWKVAFKGVDGNPAHTAPMVCFALITEGQGGAKQFRVVGMCAHANAKSVEICEKDENFIGYLNPLEALNKYAKETETE